MGLILVDYSGTCRCSLETEAILFLKKKNVIINMHCLIVFFNKLPTIRRGTRCSLCNLLALYFIIIFKKYINIYKLYLLVSEFPV